MKKLVTSLAVFFIASMSYAQNKTICVYIASDGSTKQVNSIGLVPDASKPYAKCFDATQNSYMASPEQVTLKGNIRSAEIVSPLGTIDLRWQRSIETLFGRTPERAMADAAASVNRALKSSGFPPELQRLSLDWKVVFMDETMPTGEIPHYLVSNCHPAWMTPPANLYVVAQRVVAGCTGKQASASTVNDGELSQVLIHEIGHAIEYAILKGHGAGDRMRAEGFASWFEQYGSDFSSTGTRGRAKKIYAELAKKAFAASPDQFQFNGTADDYARASMFFHVIVFKRGIKGLMNVYGRMVQNDDTFFGAVNAEIGLSPSALNAEAMKMVKLRDT